MAELAAASPKLDEKGFEQRRETQVRYNGHVQYLQRA